MLKGDSYWGAPGSAAEVIKAEKKDKKGGAKGAQGAKGVKVGGKKVRGAKIANKDPKVLKAQQAAKQLLAAKKVRACALSNARTLGGDWPPARVHTPALRRSPRSQHALASSRFGLTGWLRRSKSQAGTRRTGLLDSCSTIPGPTRSPPRAAASSTSATRT
jgi:hypothetical protein